jgi:hypothetical protein
MNAFDTGFLKRATDVGVKYAHALEALQFIKEGNAAISGKSSMNMAPPQTAKAPNSPMSGGALQGGGILSAIRNHLSSMPSPNMPQAPMMQQPKPMMQPKPMPMAQPKPMPARQPMQMPMR